MEIPQINEPLNEQQLSFLKTFSKSCRSSIIEMVKNSQSGHPGGSLSSLDFLTLIYTFIISQTGEDAIISHGHISPAVYSVLAELKYINKEDVINNFRKIDTIYEGHITRHVPGVVYGTGPLGVGASIASALALAEKMQKTDQKTFCLFGDGEAQEGQIHEMIHFAAHYKLNNLVAFCDYNQVQLTDSLDEVMPIDIKATFQAANWNVIEVDGHDFPEMWNAISTSYQKSDKPTLILGLTTMGKGVPGMEEDGLDLKSTWHGKAPKPEEADQMLKQIQLTQDEKQIIEDFSSQNIKWKPKETKFPKLLDQTNIDQGEAIFYDSETFTDCRSAYGKALLSLAEKNSNVLAMSADLRGSVMTKFVAEKIPSQHIECGIAEQHMVSCAGGLSLKNYIPFCSTFGAFLSSRAKDQARVNDINNTNVKMVATHCGLSVGEDGPTHQAIDDIGSFLGMYNTMIIEPADPNHTDRIIRYIASHHGNCYVRMGRHKIPTITKEDGSPFYDKEYQFQYGKSDLLREGNDITVAAAGSLVTEALKAQKESNKSIEVIALSCPKQVDETLINSIKKTKKLIILEDHNIYSGYASQVSRILAEKNIQLDSFISMGTKEYQLSGTSEQLYKKAKLDSKAVLEKIENL